MANKAHGGTTLDGLINDCIFTAASPLKSVTCVFTTDPILMSGKRSLCPIEEFMHGFMRAPTRKRYCRCVHMCHDIVWHESKTMC